MNALAASTLALVALVCGPDRPVAGTSSPSTAGALAVSGTFAQTGITGLQVSSSGQVTLIEQTSFGEVDGSLAGSFEDDLQVVIKPGGRFSAAFTLALDCTLDGRQGTVTLQAADVGQLVGPTTGYFAGVASITGATGDLAGLSGSLAIEGMVDLVSGLSTYSYEGTLRTGW